MDDHAHGYAPRRPTPDDDARLSQEVDRAGHLLDSGDLGGAVTALGDVLGWAESLYGPADADVLMVRSELGRALGGLGRHYEAVDVLGQGVVLARELGPDDAELRSGLIHLLIGALEASGRGEETPALHRELDDVVARGGHEAPGPHEARSASGPQGVGEADAGARSAPAEDDAGFAARDMDPVGRHARVDDTGSTFDRGRTGSSAASSHHIAAAGPTGPTGPGSSDLPGITGEDRHGDDREVLAEELRAAAADEQVDVGAAEELVRRAASPANRQLLPDALLILANARSRAGDTLGSVDAHGHRAQAVASLDGPTSGTALRASVRHVTALVEAGLLDDALDTNMFLGRDVRRHRPDDLELADLTTARSADLLAAMGRFDEARQVFAELVALRASVPGLGPEHEATLDARHREAWATLEVDPARALEMFHALSDDMQRLLPGDHPLIAQTAQGVQEARSDLNLPG